MKITTKRKAMEILTASLFTPGGTLSKGKFCASKNKWHGSQNYYVGKDVPDLNGVKAVYVERRQDSEGPYAILMSIHETNRGNNE